MVSAGDDVQIWCVLLFGAELSMVAFGRRDQDIQGRGGAQAAEEEACYVFSKADTSDITRW